MQQFEEEQGPLLEHYGSVLVEDHEGLWRRWPSETR
jgi:hypothetical protein